MAARELNRAPLYPVRSEEAVRPYEGFARTWQPRVEKRLTGTFAERAVHELLAHTEEPFRGQYAQYRGLHLRRQKIPPVAAGQRALVEALQPRDWRVDNRDMRLWPYVLVRAIGFLQRGDINSAQGPLGS